MMSVRSACILALGVGLAPWVNPAPGVAASATVGELALPARRASARTVSPAANYYTDPASAAAGKAAVPRRSATGEIALPTRRGGTASASVAAPIEAPESPTVRPAVFETMQTLLPKQWSTDAVPASSFCTDYKVRSESQQPPPRLRGPGINGRDVPYGCEDQFRGCVPSDFAPTDLVLFPRERSFCRQPIYLRQEAAQSLLRMFNDAQRQGLHLELVSGYRDMRHQRRLYAQSHGSGSVAAPGRSEHQFGVTIDVTNSERYLLRKSFGDTAEGRWLSRNSPSYGWYLTCVSGSGANARVTEPWHFRYYGQGARKSPGSAIASVGSAVAEHGFEAAGKVAGAVGTAGKGVVKVVNPLNWGKAASAE